MDKLNKARIAEIPLSNFKSIKIKDKQGEEKVYSPKEFKKFLEEKTFGGISLSQMEKELVKAGIEGSQWKERKRLMDLFDKIVNPAEDGESKEAKKKALEEFLAYLDSLEQEESEEEEYKLT